MPRADPRIEDDLAAGRAAVIQLVSTGAALMERRIAEIPASEWDDLTIDLTPRDGILSFLMHAFPVHLQEPFTDDGGNLMSRPVVDADGNPVICREAEARRRVHYLLEPGWRADQAIQGLGRTHRTHQASAPLFRPVTTDVKGERRFIATIARRHDSLGAITRGQRDSQTAMGGGDTALFRESDNLESAYAKAALRQFYGALWRGRITGWTAERFRDATGLAIVHEGSLKDDLPPMPKFLNRLLALPIAEQNGLFAELEARIAANIEQAVEAGSYEAGVETVTADSLAVAGRETLYAHPGTGAKTELVEIIRRDKLEPLSAEAALEIAGGTPFLMVNARSKRAAVVLPAPSRTLDDGGLQERVRLLRPTVRETMARAELDASAWRRAGGPAMTGAEAFEAVMDRGTALPLANGWRLARRRIMGAARVEIEGPADTDVPALKRLGCTVEIVSWRARVFAPSAGVLERVIERRPLAA